MAEKEKGKYSLQSVGKSLTRGISWQTMGVLFIILFFIISVSNKVASIETTLETQLKPLINAELPNKISKIEAQSTMLYDLFMHKDNVVILKEDATKHLNPVIEDGLIVFLEKMKEEEFTKINNSSQSERQKVIEIIVKIGGIEELMDLLGTKDRRLAYGIVYLFVENYIF